MGLESLPENVLHSLHIKPAPVYAVINVFGLNNTSPVCLPCQLMSAFTFIISTFKRRLYKSCYQGGSEEKALRLNVHKEQRPKIQGVQDEPRDGICILRICQLRDLLSSPKDIPPGQSGHRKLGLTLAATRENTDFK